MILGQIAIISAECVLPESRKNAPWIKHENTLVVQEEFEVVPMYEYHMRDVTYLAGIVMETKKVVHFVPSGIQEFPQITVAKGVIANSNGGALIK